MRVGYSMSTDDVPLLEQAEVDYIVLTDDKKEPLQAFQNFLETHKGHNLVLVGIHSIGLDISLIQLYDIFQQLINESYSVTFLDKGMEREISDQDYMELIWHLMKNEKRAIKRRTRKGIEKARAKGIFAGRPPVTPEVVEQIHHLHLKEKRTIREIAITLDVSIGTVHKYLQKKPPVS